jgi:uncharacterized repeat protein (TIGR01451 family)
MNKKIFFVSLFMLLLLTASYAGAQKKSPIVLKSVVEVEVEVKNKKGETEIVRKDVSKQSIIPGDTLVLTTFYSNTGDKSVTNIAIKNPVSANMVFISGSAEGKNTKIEFSVDKGKTYGLPAALRIKKQDGTERKATAADYTNVKWTLTTPLDPGVKGSVSFKAKLK